MKITVTDIAIVVTYLIALIGLTSVIYIAVREPKKSKR